MTGWPYAALGDVAEIERGVIDPRAIQDGTTYVGLEHLTSEGTFASPPEVRAGELASSKFAFTPAHLLYGKLRPYLAKIARPNFGGVCSTDILPVRPGPTLDRSYLHHYLRLPTMVALASSRSVGANLPRLAPRVLAAFKIPLAPLAEQCRIAEVLDRAETLRAQRRQALAQLDALAESIFLDMFGDPVSNPKNWPRKAIGAIGRVVTGSTPSRANIGYYGSAVEWIKSDNLNTPHDYATPATEHLSEAGTAVARLAPAGSILVTCIAGSPDCIGNAAMVDRKVAFNQQINALTPEQGDWRFWYSQLTVGKRLVQAASTEGMKGIVSKSRFERIQLIAPPEPLQREFADRRDVVSRMKANQATAMAETDALFASLQHRAFRGEL